MRMFRLFVGLLIHGADGDVGGPRGKEKRALEFPPDFTTRAFFVGLSIPALFE
jgi:hypothetical protein